MAKQEGKFSLVMEFLSFLKKEGKWWLTPIVIILVLLGVLLLVAESSVLAPFIYTLF